MKTNNESDYDLVISKLPNRDNLSPDKVHELYKDDFPETRMKIVLEILITKNILNWSTGYRLTGTGMEIKADLKNKGFVAQRRKEQKKKLVAATTLIISALTLLFV